MSTHASLFAGGSNGERTYVMASNIIAGPKGLTPGEEIFVPYTHGSSYILTADDVDDNAEKHHPAMLKSIIPPY